MRCAMWRLLPDSWLLFCPCSSVARVMTCSYVVPVHQQGQWWPIVFSLYEGALQVLHYVTWLVVQIYECGTLIFVTCLSNVILTVFFRCHFVFYRGVFWNHCIFEITLCIWLFLYSSIRNILLLHILRHCMVVWEYCSSLAQLELDTYVVPRH